jgi:prepilin-type N-terminal cleavage/methylation domain-containing protein/prepilin-type processing-associated H-X9-DG protein
MRHCKLRHGVTLIELLVVIAILGVLMGLLLPAITRVQEASQQTACKNNLRQIGIALQGYHQAHKGFPSAYIYDPSQNPSNPGATKPGWGWGTLLLPHVEQDAIYERVKLERPLEVPQFNEIRVQHLGVYVCPSDQRTGRFWVVDEKSAEEGGLGTPIAECYTNSYAANYGKGKHIGENPGIGDGLFFRNSHVNMRDVRDGLSNTFAVGERAAHFAQAPWAGAVSAGIVKTGDYDPSIDTVDNYWFEEAPVQVMAGFNPDCKAFNHKKSNAYCFFSPHSGTGNFVFADGAVHSISFHTSFSVLQALCTRDGGEVVSHTEY